MKVLAGKWSKGEINGYKFEVKHFENGAESGIDGGRISKLRVTKDGVEVASYDRGWDVLPSTDEAREATGEIIQRFN